MALYKFAKFWYIFVLPADKRITFETKLAAKKNILKLVGCEMYKI